VLLEGVVDLADVRVSFEHEHDRSVRVDLLRVQRVLAGWMIAFMCGPVRFKLRSISV